MNLYCAVLVKDQLRKDKYILVFIAQLPVRQVDLSFACIAHHNPLGTQRPGAELMICRTSIQKWSSGSPSGPETGPPGAVDTSDAS